MAKAKTKKSFLPKRIAGVKVPKAVRRGQFGELLASPTGQKLIAQAIVAGGALVAAKQAASDPKVRAAAAGAKAKVAKKVEAAAATADPGAMARALAEAARRLADALQGGYSAEPRSFERSWNPLEGTDGADAGKKPPGGSGGVSAST